MWKDILKQGQCYQLALSWMMENTETDAIMIHADVTGTGGDIKGQVYGHAFILIDDNTVYDVCQKISIPKDIYYKVGNVTNERAYTLQEAVEQAIESGHYGPW